MQTAQKEKPLFEKVGECLYKYRPSGGHYGRVNVGGKEIRRSLETNDRAVAKSNLADLKKEPRQVDLSAGKITLGDLCDRCTVTVQHQKRKTIEAKTNVIARMKTKWPGGVSQT